MRASNLRCRVERAMRPRNPSAEVGMVNVVTRGSLDPLTLSGKAPEEVS